MSWFEDLFGFQEPKIDGNTIDFNSLYQNFELEDSLTEPQLLSKANGKRYSLGLFSNPTLEEMRRETSQLLARYSDEISGEFEFEHIVVNDLVKLHASHPGAIFQAASQFNCLEFPDPNITPDFGITDYVYDRTQGPTCAMAAAPGTVYRNYFVPMRDNSGKLTRGQRADRQLNNLATLESYLGNQPDNFWTVSNGYIFSSGLRLTRLSQHVLNMDRDTLLQKVRVGIQKNTAVVFNKLPCNSQSMISSHDSESGDEYPRVTQVYCSACSCGYNQGIHIDAWEKLASWVLDAAYEATLRAALLPGVHPFIPMPKDSIQALGNSLNLSLPHSSSFSLSLSLPSSLMETPRTYSPTTSSSLSADLNNRFSSSAAIESASLPLPNKAGSSKIAARTPRVFLTFVGGGVFGNRIEWIAKAIARAMAIMTFSQVRMKVSICHYRQISVDVRSLIDEEYHHILATKRLSDLGRF